MSRTPLWAVAGACALATAYTAERAIAPFTGVSLTLFASILGAGLAGFAAGCALGARSPDAPGGRTVARALVAAAGVTLLVAAAHHALFVALFHVELRLATLVAALACAGLPCLCLGVAFSAGFRDASGAAVLKEAAWLLAGAAIAAPITGYLLVPRVGVTFTLAIAGALEALLAGVLGTSRSPAIMSVARAGAILSTALWISSRGAAAHHIGPRILALREGTRAEYRVFDRDGARYLLADGTIHAVIDTLSGDCVQRAPAALEFLKILKPGRDSLLVLGLRGGALPLAFARTGWHVHVVEPDPDAVAVSRGVAYKPGELPLTAADPRTFFRRDRIQRSVIVVDAFGDSYMPYTLCTREFVAQLADHLQDNGVLVYVFEAHGWGDPLIGSLGATLRTRFAHVTALPTSEPQTALGSILLLASRHPVTIADNQLPDPVTYFQNPDALWRVQQLTHAWLNRYEPQPGNAPVLTDDRSRIEVWSDRINHAERGELHEFFGPQGGSF